MTPEEIFKIDQMVYIKDKYGKLSKVPYKIIRVGRTSYAEVYYVLNNFGVGFGRIFSANDLKPTTKQ